MTGDVPPVRVPALSARMLFVVGDRVLLASRRGATWFFLPGGNARPGETVEVALHRELRAATGLVAHTLDFVGCFEHRYTDEPEPTGGPDPAPGIPRYELNVVFAAELPLGIDIASRDPDVDVNSVRIYDVPEFEFRPPLLGELLLGWLATHRPTWTGPTWTGPA